MNSTQKKRLLIVLDFAIQAVTAKILYDTRQLTGIVFLIEFVLGLYDYN